MNSAKTYLVGIVLGMALMAATGGYVQSEEQKALEARRVEREQLRLKADVIAPADDTTVPATVWEAAAVPPSSIDSRPRI